ncbi:MAG TPA: hypothetical protein VL358_09555 [Caulobacteraceae bacterium]|nr:hypothetical protein [Caulobacteraceae bacterium]
MKRPGPGSQKKVTAENLAGLGAERLAEILVSVAETRVDLKRRLRMELAAQQGPGPLAAEIDKRLGAFETSRGQITWRARPAFIRDLDALRDLIIARLAPLDASAAIDRFWRFMDAAGQSTRRYRERNGELEAVFVRAAGDLGGLLAAAAPGPSAAALVDSLVKNPSGWKAWLPALLTNSSQALAKEALRFMSERRGAVPGWIALIRQLADAALDVDAYRATYTDEALSAPHVAAEIGRRYLAAERTDEAGEVLRIAAPKAATKRGGAAEPDLEWETVWIDYLDAAGDGGAAQAVRWASFERTLSPDRARAFIGRLADFDDVEAEARAFAIAAAYPDFEKGLRFLMAWPALADASRMIEARADEIQVDPEAAELWSSKLRRRFPKAAHLLLRKAAAAAFRRRDFKTCDRLSAEAETIAV